MNESLSATQAVTDLLEKDVQAGKFTAWSVGSGRFQLAFGQSRLSACFADEWLMPRHSSSLSGDNRSRIHPVFDLGSLTKMILGGGLHFLHHGPAALDPSVLAAPLSDVMSHRAGFVPWLWMGRALWNDQGKTLGQVPGEPLSAERIVCFGERLLQLALESKSNVSETRYSDVGYFFLARAYEAREGWAGWTMALERMNQSWGTSFLHASLSPSQTAQAVPFFPYVVAEQEPGRSPETWRSFGPVHDTNANLLALLSPVQPQVSLHAGLFGSVADVQRSLTFFADKMSGCRSEEGKRFFLCFDTPQTAETLSGSAPSDWRRTFGHLGYTGTSAWFQTQTDKLPDSHWILLTNRTAHRSLRRRESVPRLLAREEDGEVFFAANFGRGFEPLTADDFWEIRDREVEASQILWDQAYCQTTPNIASTRRSLGHILFKKMV